MPGIYEVQCSKYSVYRQVDLFQREKTDLLVFGLINFVGCIVICWFLDRVCTHILAFEGDSQVYYFEGGFSDYEENKKKRLGDTEPTRVKYKKLMKTD